MYFAFQYLNNNHAIKKTNKLSVNKKIFCP